MTKDYPRQTKEEFIQGVGNTPLIKLETYSKEIGRDIYFKAEYTNSGKSIKDRPSIYLLNDALDKGRLKLGGTLVEATAGNTGIALALLARTFNPPFKVRLYVPDFLVQAKIDVLEELGAEVIKKEIFPPDHPEFINNLAKKYAEEHENAYHVNQMDNLANRRAHFETTGPEIWKQTNGRLDAFIVGCGTGGTFSGAAEYLKKTSNGRVKAYIADREGSGLHSYIQSKGDNFDSEGESFIEGVGKKALVGNMVDVLDLADGSFRILDTDVLVTMYELLDEGYSVGGSGGLNITAAKELAKTLPEGSVVITTVADAGERYASKALNKEWLIENGHWDAIPDHLKKYATYKSTP